jgi:hypothetical protein
MSNALWNFLRVWLDGEGHGFEMRKTDEGYEARLTEHDDATVVASATSPETPALAVTKLRDDCRP